MFVRCSKWIRFSKWIVFVGLCTLVDSAAVQAATTTQLINNSLALTYDDGMGGTMPYRLFLPPGINEAGAKFPVTIFMHGAGERGTDNLLHVSSHISGLIDSTQSSEFASILIAPQLPSGASWNPSHSRDFTFDILQDVIRDYSADQDRLYLTGLSLGGFGTSRYAIRFPDLFAAAVPMSGAVSMNATQAETIRDVPFWLFHGDQDGVVDVQRSRNFVNELQGVDGNVHYEEIIGGRHNIWSPIYDDWQSGNRGLYPWMFAQTRAVAIPEPSSFSLLIIGTGLLATRRRVRRCA